MPKQCIKPGCERPQFGGKFCDWHQSLRTDKKPKAISKFSKKYAPQVAEYNNRVKVWKEENPICRFPGCGRPTEDCHHAAGRGKNLLDERLWIPLCRDHHEYIELHPFEAKELGFSVNRNIR